MRSLPCLRLAKGRMSQRHYCRILLCLCISSVALLIISSVFLTGTHGMVSALKLLMDLTQDMISISNSSLKETFTPILNSTVSKLSVITVSRELDTNWKVADLNASLAVTSRVTPLKSRYPLPETTRSLPATQRILCHAFVGRLGNQIFQYASVLGLASTMSRVGIFTNSRELAHILKTPPRSPKGEELDRCSKSKHAVETACCRYSSELTTLDANFDFTVETYLQSWKYFEKIKDHVKEALTFSDPIVQTASEIVRNLKAAYKNSTLVGVHIRKGDMDKKSAEEFGYVTATPDYINRSMTYFHELFPDAVFVVFSDNSEWCKRHCRPTFHIVIMALNSAAVDLTVLSLLDHIIISTGTFSWWAGYLNRGVTVYLKDFIRANTTLGQQFSSGGKDYVYPDWVPL